MLLLAWRSFLDRWQVFIGAIVTVCLGVALVQSSLLLLTAAATAPIPARLLPEEAHALRETYDGALIVLSMVLTLAVFVAVFIVSSTFSFAVSQRRAELALIRLNGADRRQLRSLLVGEATLLGLVGSALGMVVGLAVMRAQVWLLIQFDFAPPGFAAPFRWWIIVVSLGTGVLIAVLGVLAASRRASQIRPLEALRESGQAASVMTGSRWASGLLFTFCGAAMLVIVPSSFAALPAWFIQLTPFLVAIPLVIGFSALAPLIVPLVSRLLGLVFRSPLGELAQSNLRFDAQRSASTAAPIMLLFACVLSISGTLNLVNEAARQEAQRDLRADFVVTTEDPAAAEIAGLEGVALVSQETAVPFEFKQDEHGDVWYEVTSGLAVDPATYLQIRDVQATDGDLAALSGPTIAVSPSEAPGPDWHVGDTVQIRLDGQDREVQVAALLPGTMSGPFTLLSSELIPPDARPWQHVVRLADGADQSAVAAQLEEFGTVETLDRWIVAAATDFERLTFNILIQLLGITMLYTVIAIVNAVVIAASARRREFAMARVTGLTRPQVVRVALWESQAVVLIGLLLGGLATGGTILTVSWGIRNLTGITVVSMQWPLWTGLALGSAVVVGATNVVTTFSATRTAPIRLVASRE